MIEPADGFACHLIVEMQTLECRWINRHCTGALSYDHSKKKVRIINGLYLLPKWRTSSKGDVSVRNKNNTKLFAPIHAISFAIIISVLITKREPHLRELLV